VVLGRLEGAVCLAQEHADIAATLICRNQITNPIVVEIADGDSESAHAGANWITDGCEKARDGSVFEDFESKKAPTRVPWSAAIIRAGGRHPHYRSQPLVSKDSHDCCSLKQAVCGTMARTGPARRPSAGMVPGWGGTCLPAEPPRPSDFSAQKRRF